MESAENAALDQLEISEYWIGVAQKRLSILNAIQSGTLTQKQIIWFQSELKKLEN